MNILIYGAHNGETLDSATSRAVTAAKEIGGDISLLIAGAPRSVAGEAAKIDGVKKVLWTGDAACTHQLAEPVAALIARQAEGFDVVLAAASAITKAIFPRAAALCDIPMVSEITKVTDAETFERPVYAGSLIATVKCPGRKCITIRRISFTPSGAQPAAPVEEVAVMAAPAPTRFVSESRAQPSGKPTLADAKIVVSGGRGVASKEGFEKIEALAEVLHAAVGASRAAVDGGMAPNEYQVGQSGHTIAPEIYLAAGISGAIQHMAGIRESRIIAAINKDPDAPIFASADIGLVGDLHTILPALTERLKGRV